MKQLIFILFSLSNSLIALSEIDLSEQIILISISSALDVIIFILLYYKFSNAYLIRTLLITQVILIFSICEDPQYLQFTILYHILIRTLLDSDLIFAKLELLSVLVIVTCLQTDSDQSQIIRSIICYSLLWIGIIYQKKKIKKDLGSATKHSFSPPLETSQQPEKNQLLHKHMNYIGLLILDNKLNVNYVNEKMHQILENLDCTIQQLLNELKIIRIDSQSKQILKLKTKDLNSLSNLLLQINNQNIIVQVLDFSIFQLKNHMITIYSNEEEFEITFQNVQDRDKYKQQNFLVFILSQLFRTFSHEFGTSLNYLLALSQVGLEQCQESLQFQYFQPIQSMGSIMHHYLLDMTDFNDILGKKFKLQFEQLDIDVLLARVMDLFQAQLNKKGLRFEYFNLLPNNQITSDARRIEQVLVNLIANAQKFTFTGGISVYVKPAEQPFIIFEVVDTGIGMSESDCQSLRNQLSLSKRGCGEIENVVTSHTAGFGLGCFLANMIAQGLANNLCYNEGGGLKFERRKEGGMIFSFKVMNSYFNLKLANSDSFKVPIITSKAGYFDLRKSILDNTTNTFLKKLTKSKSILHTLGVERMQSMSFEKDIIREFAFQRTISKLKHKQTLSDSAKQEINEDEHQERIHQFEILQQQVSRPHSKQLSTPCFTQPPLLKYKYSDKVPQKCSLSKESSSSPGKFEVIKVIEVEDEDNSPEFNECDCIPILIVDDEMINILGLQLMLKQLNIESDYAYNGVEALNKVQQRCQNHCQYKVIFMDINMPLKDGFAATKDILHLKLPKPPIIIACTAFTDVDTKNHCYECGMSQFMNKPVNKVELIKIIQFTNL